MRSSPTARALLGTPLELRKMIGTPFHGPQNGGYNLSKHLLRLYQQNPKGGDMEPKILEELEQKFVQVVNEFRKAEEGNKSAGRRFRVGSVQIREALKSMRAYSVRDHR